MISTENLQMIPPVLGRERTYGWYPPAYHQFAKAPYKSMAVLDDYSLFKNNVNGDKADGEDCEIEPIIENGGTVLSSKLNAIRQDLARRRIDPTIIKNTHMKKYESVNHLMNVSPNWKPKYPVPAFEIKSETQAIHSAPIQSEDRTPLPEEKHVFQRKLEDKLKMFSSKNQLNVRSRSSCQPEMESENKSRDIGKTRIERPHTAPERFLKANKRETCTRSSNRGRIHSTNNSHRNQTPPPFSNHNKTIRSQSVNQMKSYEDDLIRYKWMMEIPGDPFNIKQPHIPEKQPYFQKIDDCVILPPELRMPKQNRDTFFYNTVPIQSLSFDISPHFTSEKYNKMKNILRSQGKWNYSSKNFSFVY